MQCFVHTIIYTFTLPSFVHFLYHFVSLLLLLIFNIDLKPDQLVCINRLLWNISICCLLWNISICCVLLYIL